MAKLSFSRGSVQREKTPSILVENVGQDDFDLSECWGGYVASRWRDSCPDKKAASASPWSSHFTSLSSNLRGASAALTARAKQLHVGESTRRAITHLRRSMVEPSSPYPPPLPRAASMPIPTQNLLNDSDVENLDDQPEAEDESSDSFPFETDQPSRFQASKSRSKLGEQM